MEKDKLQIFSSREEARNEKIMELMNSYYILQETMPEYIKTIREKYLQLIEAGFTEQQALNLSQKLI